MLISTPCSGPFMAVAMGYALQQPALQQFILFTGFGLGIAVPYVVLSSSPRLLKKLPRPGAWMETFKHALAFPMFAAAIYFYNTFGEKTGFEGSSLLLWSLLCLAVGAWIYGHWCVPSRSTRTRFIGGLTALLSVAAGTALALDATRTNGHAQHQQNVAQDRTGNRCFDHLDLAFTQGSDGDDQLCCVAKAGVHQPAQPRAQPVRNHFSRVAHQPRQRHERDAAENERVDAGVKKVRRDGTGQRHLENN